jgi:hypothetical protein
MRSSLDPAGFTPTDAKAAAGLDVNQGRRCLAVVCDDIHFNRENET